MLAAYLDVTPPTLANWERAAKLPRSVQFAGKALRYRKADLLHWLAEREGIANATT
jgi:hypothetical protein